jgi:hypothetical protein
MDRLDPGLTLADALKPGAGWLAANIRDSNDAPASVVVEAGAKLNPNWAAYGDVWAQPTVGQYGAEAGARYKSKLDLFAGAQADLHGDWEANAGLRLNF